MQRLVIMVSGNGTNMENLIKKMREGSLKAEPALVICDRPGAGAIEKAKKLDVPVALVERKRHPDKASFEAEMMRRIDEIQPAFIVLAGYMRILSETFVNKYWGRIINIHPSLLPAFPGANGIRDAFEAGVEETGVTVHFVDNGVDTGPMILQRKVPVSPGDSLESLEEKVHAVEYELYPEALNKVLSGEIRMPSLS